MKTSIIICRMFSFCLCTLFLFIPAMLSAKITAGTIIIETEQVFRAGEYAGQEVVLVTVNDVMVSAHKGKTIYAYARIIRDANPPFCEKQIVFKIETEKRKPGLPQILT